MVGSVVFDNANGQRNALDADRLLLGGVRVVHRTDVKTVTGERRTHLLLVRCPRRRVDRQIIVIVHPRRSTGGRSI